MPKTALTSTFNFTPEASYNVAHSMSTRSSRLKPNSTTASNVSTASNVTTRSSILTAGAGILQTFHEKVVFSKCTP